MSVKFSFTINGKSVEGDVEDRTLLVQYIRENLGLTGTHVGCDTTQCGCCTVHIDGTPMKSCTMLAVQADGCEVTTIEGLAKDGELHPNAGCFPRKPRSSVRFLHPRHGYERHWHRRSP